MVDPSHHGYIYPTYRQVRFDTRSFYFEDHVLIKTFAWPSQKMLDPIGIPHLDHLGYQAINSARTPSGPRKTVMLQLRVNIASRVEVKLINISSPQHNGCKNIYFTQRKFVQLLPFLSSSVIINHIKQAV